MFAFSSLSNEHLRMELLHLKRDLSDHYDVLQSRGGHLSELYNWKVARFTALEAFANAQFNISFIEQRVAANARWMNQARWNQRPFNRQPAYYNINKPRNKRIIKNAAPTSHASNNTQKAIESNNNVGKQQRVNSSNQPVEGTSNVVIKQEKVDESYQPTVADIGNVVVKQEKDAGKQHENVVVIKQERVDDGYEQFSEAVNKMIQHAKVNNKRKSNNANNTHANKRAKLQ